MALACLLHIDGNVATIMVRWISGPNVNAHLDVAATLLTLKPIARSPDIYEDIATRSPDIYEDIARILTIGSPGHCNASASEANFQRYLKYGNHKSVTK